MLRLSFVALVRQTTSYGKSSYVFSKNIRRQGQRQYNGQKHGLKAKLAAS
jgi:hypothetical protein